jgi:uncharacterized protein YjdB
MRYMHIGDKTRRGIIALIVYAALLTAFASPAFAEPAAVEQSVTGTTSDESPAAATDENGAATDDTDVPVEPPPPVSIDITGYPRDMTVGDRGTIKYEVENAGAGAKVKWNSGDDDIATVDSDGEVRAFAAGKVEITASIGDAKASILISVEEKVINPESFSVEVEEFTAADMLLSRHDLDINDELHMSVKVTPSDADITGKFEWDTSGDGIAAIEVSGDRGENAVLTAKTAGEVSLTVKYVDETEDESKRVSLDDYRLVFSIVKVEEEPDDSLLMTIVIAAAAVAVITLITVLIVKGHRRRAERERRARIAQKKRDMAERENAEHDERERLIMEGYERGYRDSEADRFEGMTRVYDDLPTGPPEFGPPGFEPVEFEPPEFEPVDTDDERESADESNEPEKPFSVDDIE